ncbi:hypothetical protein KBD33_06175 [Candidatus Gracilibacteria bacterium]|nr:hypothetical protein [Candidatus Gracilibacteria bacterium]
MILYLILGTIIIAIGVSFYFVKPSFEVQKSQLMNIYSSVLSDMNVDFRDNGIGVVNIVDISQSIKNFSNEILKMRHRIHDTENTEQEWLVNLIEEFNNNLHLWIERHASELKIQDDIIGEINTPNISEKSVLELASKRLENQIKILERI